MVRRRPMRCDRSHAPEGDDRAGGPPFVLWTAMTVVAVLACSPRAFADDMPWLDLTVRAPPICPPGTEIEHEITRLVGDAPRDKGRLKATIDIAGIDDRTWRARVHTEYGGEGGERTLEGGTCRAVARAAALVVALTVDSHAGAAEEPPPARPPEIMLLPP